MFRKTTLKISLCSAFATLFLLVAMLASSGTVSAHTASSHATASSPQITQRWDAAWSNCVSYDVEGTGFAPGPVRLFARNFGSPNQLSGFPVSETANSLGHFSDLNVDICNAALVVIWAVDQNGVSSNSVVVI